MWTLRSTNPVDLQLSFRLMPGDVKTIGRAAGAQIVVDAPLVSRVHCRLTLTTANDLHVEDLDSTNGTFVNDRKVKGLTALQPEDTLRVGRVAFRVNRV
jgi:pSer/pThr/pTyr-binding forkhead associated (FHA) protein